jgi:hypothetical protein
LETLRNLEAAPEIEFEGLSSVDGAGDWAVDGSG